MQLELRGKKYGVRYSLNGKDRRQSLKTGNRAVAERRLEEFRIKLDRIKRGKAGLLFEEALVGYLKHCDKTLKERSVKRYRSMAKTVLHFFQGQPLASITKQSLRDFIDRRQKGEFSKKGKVTSQTIRCDLFFLQGLMRWARQNDSLPTGHDPFADLDFSDLKVSPHRVRWLDDATRALFLSKLPPGYAGMAAFSMETGLRWNELRLMRWEWFKVVQLVDGDTKIARPVLELPARFTVGIEKFELTKNDKPRTVPLTQLALDALRQSPSAGEREGWVWPLGWYAQPPTQVPKVFLKVRAELGLGDLRWHDLRHHAASTWRQSGMDLGYIKDLLGHADYKTTLRYAHVGPQHLVRAIAGFDRARGGSVSQTQEDQSFSDLLAQRPA